MGCSIVVTVHTLAISDKQLMQLMLLIIFATIAELQG